MKESIMAVYDNKAQAHGNIFTVPQVGMAVRDFGEECRKPESPLNKFPEDYALICLGTIDRVSGKIVGKREVVAFAKNYAEVKKR